MDAYELAAKLMMPFKTDMHTATIEAAKLLVLQADKIADLQTTIKFLEEECAALREQV